MIKVLLIISGIAVVVILVPIIVYFIILAGATGFYRAKRMVEKDQNNQDD